MAKIKIVDFIFVNGIRPLGASGDLVVATGRQVAFPRSTYVPAPGSVGVRLVAPLDFAPSECRPSE